MTCRWNDILRGKKKGSQFSLAWFFFFPFTFQNLVTSEAQPSRWFCSLPSSYVGRKREKRNSQCWWRTTREKGMAGSSAQVLGAWTIPSHPIPAREAGGYHLCHAEPLVGAPGLILNKWPGSTFALKVVKQGILLQSLHERKKHSHHHWYFKRCKALLFPDDWEGMLALINSVNCWYHFRERWFIFLQ